MPFFRLKTYYLKTKETKLDIMQLFVSKLIKKGLKFRAKRIWIDTLVQLKKTLILSEDKYFKELIINQQKFIAKDHFLGHGQFQSFGVSSPGEHEVNLDLYFFCLSLKLYSECFHPLDYILYCAMEQVAPIVLFIKEQKKRHLNFVPIYAKNFRGFKFGVTWIVLIAKSNSKNLNNISNNLSLEIYQAAIKSPKSESIKLKFHYYALAERNRKLIRNRYYF